jgi:hypothetical protein
MTQAERDRLVVLKKAKKGLITQTEAAVELQVARARCGGWWRGCRRWATRR